MLRAVTLPGTELETTTLGFGCADLYRLSSAGERRRLLEIAHGVGIRHFDAAPMYGLGLAERELGRFAHGRRDQLVIATKFGIAPTFAARGLARVQGPLRRVLSAFPALRRQARARAAGPGSGPAGALLYNDEGFSAASASASLERSLRQLGTDHVDLLLLHDPAPGGVRSDDVCGYLEGALQAGKIRAWGLSGELDPTLAVARALPAGKPVLQVRDDILTRSLSSISTDAFPARIAFGVIGRAVEPIVAHVTADPGRRRRWREAVGCDCGEPETTASLLLRHALRDNRAGTVLFSTINAHRIEAAAAAANADDESAGPDLNAFVGLVDGELRTSGATAGVDG
jgi:D-threo-aldose 1-dehydrogenase